MARADAGSWQQLKRDVFNLQIISRIPTVFRLLVTMAQQEMQSFRRSKGWGRKGISEILDHVTVKIQNSNSKF